MQFVLQEEFEMKVIQNRKNYGELIVYILLHITIITLYLKVYNLKLFSYCDEKVLKLWWQIQYKTCNTIVICRSQQNCLLCQHNKVVSYWRDDVTRKCYNVHYIHTHIHIYITQLHTYIHTQVIYNQWYIHKPIYVHFVAKQIYINIHICTTRTINKRRD